MPYAFFVEFAAAGQLSLYPPYVYDTLALTSLVAIGAHIFSTGLPVNVALQQELPVAVQLATAVQV